jgi:hypothetical protein
LGLKPSPLEGEGLGGGEVKAGKTLPAHFEPDYAKLDTYRRCHAGID